MVFTMYLNKKTPKRVFNFCGGDRGIVIPTLYIRGPLSLRFEPRNFVSGSNPKSIIDDKNKTPKRVFNFCGGDRGIRTLDRVASIRDFESRAFNQLCHISVRLDYIDIEQKSKGYLSYFFCFSICDDFV